MPFVLCAQPGEFLFNPRDRESSPAAALDTYRGEIGITGLSLWGAAPSVRWFRSEPDRSGLVCCDGGLYYESLRRSGGCRPPVVSSDSTAALAAVATTCSRSELTLRLRLSLSDLGGLATFYPEFATRNAFGDSSRTSICLVNPAVQECMVGLVEGLPPQITVHQLVLERFHSAWIEAFDSSVRWPSRLGSCERSALAVCFCPACAKNANDAGVDADDARSRIQSLVRRCFATGSEFGGSAAGLLAEIPVLDAYTSVQAQQLNQLLDRIVSGCRVEVLLARDLEAGAALGRAVEAGRAAGVITRIPTLDALPQARAADARHSEVSLPPSVLIGPRGGDFVGAMSRLGECGISGVEIDGFGGLSDLARTTLKQGIRFARRSSGL